MKSTAELSQSTKSAPIGAPLVHRFRTDRGYYIYDSNTNRIISTSEVVSYLVSADRDRMSSAGLEACLGAQYPGQTAEWIRDAVQEYLALRTSGLFSASIRAMMRKSCARGSGPL